MDDALAMRQCSLISVYLEATSHLEKQRERGNPFRFVEKIIVKKVFKLKTSVISNYVNDSTSTF